MTRYFAACSLVFLLPACAHSAGAMLEQNALMTFASDKAAGDVAACAQQNLRGNPNMGSDGTRFWVTRESQMGVVVRYDFIPDPSGNGSRVEYRSRLRVNNGLDKVEACL